MTNITLMKLPKKKKNLKKRLIICNKTLYHNNIYPTNYAKLINAFYLGSLPNKARLQLFM